MNNNKSWRYSLHTKVRKQKYRIDVYKRTIYVPYDVTEISKEVCLLRDDFKYSIQYYIS